jgi:hypothetical protein
VALVMLHDGCQIFKQTSPIQKFDNDLLSQHENFQIASIGIQPELMRRTTPGTVLRQFYTKLTGKRR